MCQTSGNELTYTAGIPKEYKAANQQVLNTLLAGSQKGATPYTGQLSAPTNQLSNQSANIMSYLMGNMGYKGADIPRGYGGGAGGMGMGGWGSVTGADQIGYNTGIGGHGRGEGGVGVGTGPYTGPYTYPHGTPGGGTVANTPPQYSTIHQLLPYLMHLYGKG